MYKYSASTNCFYPDALLPNYTESGTLPDDLIEVSSEIFNQYTVTPEIGNERIAGENGLPAWGHTPPLTKNQILEQNEVKRQELLNSANTITADWRTELALDIISDADKDSLIKWMQYIKSVKSTDVSASDAVEWPQQPQ